MLTKSYQPLRNAVSKILRNFSSNVNISSTEARRARNAEIRVRLAASYRGLDAYGLNEGICNHLSAIAPSVDTNEDVMLIIPYGFHWSEVTPSLLIGLNAQNEVIEGEGQPENTALCIHKGIYSTRSDVKAVMHTHMPYATALTCLKEPELLMIHQNSARFFQRIAYDTQYSGLGNTFDEGKRLGHVLGKKDVLFMGNHGVMTVAKSVDIAFDDMYYLERAAMIQVLSCSTQKTLKELDENVVRLTFKSTMDVLPQNGKAHLDSTIRRLDATSPELFKKQH